MSSFETRHVLDSLVQHSAIVGPVDPETLQVSHLASGTQNAAYQVTFTSNGRPGEYVLRTPLNSQDPAAVAQYHHEYAQRRQLGIFPYQPTPLYVADRPLHMLETKAPGRHPSPYGPVWSTLAAAALGRTLGSLHAATTQPETITDDRSGEFADYYDLVVKKTFVDLHQSPAEDYISTLHYELLGRIALIEALAPVLPAKACVHNDIHNGNLLYDQPSQSMYLLDWAYSGDGDPARDLATAHTTLNIPAAEPVLPLRFDQSRLDSLLDAYVAANRTYPAREHLRRHIAAWSTLVEYCTFINLAHTLYAPDMHPERLVRRDIDWTMDISAATHQLESELTQRGLPVYGKQLTAARR